MCIQTTSLRRTTSNTMQSSSSSSSHSQSQSQSENLKTAVLELEELRRWEETKEAQYNSCTGHRRFPPACLNLLKNISGNFFCVDCEASNPQWATVTYGGLICLQCSGKHRQLGVQMSVVRSITMDSWTHKNVLAMLEGGNKQLGDFFSRHGLSSSETHSHSPTINTSAHTHSSHDDSNVNAIVDRYQTNAALFYKKNLSDHVDRVEKSGEYKGRDHSRKKNQKNKNSSNRRGRKQLRAEGGKEVEVKV